MEHSSKKSRFLLAKVVVLGAALAPVAMFAQTNAPNDPQASSQAMQGPPPNGGHMDPAARDAHMLEHMTKALNLTPDQVTQIQSIQADTRTQAQGLRADTSTTGPDRHAKMMELHKAQTEKVRAVLNDQQKAKFDAMEQRHRDHMEQKHDDSDASPAPPSQQ